MRGRADLPTDPWFVLSVVAAPLLLTGALAWWGRSELRVIVRPPDDGHDRVVLFDGDCGFCRRWMVWARSHPHAGVMYAPCQDESGLRQKAGITDAQCGQASFLVVLRRGQPVRVLSGAAAINGALERFSGWGNIGWRFLAALYRLPGLMQLENRAYRWVARNRHRFASGSCTVDEMRHRSGP